MKFFVMTDIHGMNELFEEALAWASTKMDSDDKLIFLGDYVDRGPESAEVVAHVRELTKEGHIALKGNHDVMMFENQSDWRYTYGNKTIKSYKKKYGYPPWDQYNRDRHFLNSLPMYYEHNDLIFVHAGIDPTVTMSQQNESVLLWDRRPFLDMKNPIPGKLVVHGHTPVSALPGYDWQDGRLNLDGEACFRGGQLNVAMIDENATQPDYIGNFKNEE